jgi:hypothetical protein
MRRICGFGLLALALVGISSFAQDTAAPPAGQRVFVAGHSFHLPIVQPLGQIAKSAGIKDHVLVGTQGIGGSTVTQHWEKADAMNAAKKALRAGKVDVLTLSPHLKMPDEGIDRFVELLLEHNPKGRVTVQASWLPYSDQLGKLLDYKDDDRDRTDLVKLRKANELVFGKLREQVKALNDRYAEKQKRAVVLLVPTGDAVLRLRERIAKGAVPGIAKQSSLFSDAMGHTNAPVGVLNAYCHFAVIYGRSPVGLPVPASLTGLGGDTAKANRVLQECAWEAVTAEPLSGVK